jgi:K+-transporting ATPase A subunit
LIVIVVVVVVIILLVAGLVYVMKGKNAKQNMSATKKLAEIRKRQSIGGAPQASFSNPNFGGGGGGAHYASDNF